ncbi:MAG: hypothetical protein NTZ05_04445 [Chloroflexi bacterium]|nr:hypothetical protein [Chloroflexota bacterium]
MQHPPRGSRPRPAEFGDVSAEVLEAYHNAAGRLEPLLRPLVRRAWAAVVREVASTRPDAGEAAIAFCRAAPELAAALPARRFLRWARLGGMLAGHSERAATAYYRSSPTALVYLGPAELAEWVGSGLRLCRAGNTGAAVASLFFDASPRLLPVAAPSALTQLAGLLEYAVPLAPGLSVDVLNLAIRPFAALQQADLTAFLSSGERIARHHASSLRVYFEAGASLYQRIDAGGRTRLLQAMERLALATPGGLTATLTEASLSFGPLVETHGAAPMETLARLTELSSAAAHGFLRNAVTVAAKLSPTQMADWYDRGEALLLAQESTGISFFQLQSREALEALISATPAVDLAEVREVLRLYCQALMGTTVAIVSAEQAAGHGGALSMSDGVDWEGAAIFCPARMEEFPTKDGNFEAYKVLATHQAGHLEFGTFSFAFAGEGRLLPPLRQTIARLQGKDKAYFTEFEQLFDLFPDRRLAQDLFTIAEDTRIDRQLRGEYRGIRHAFGRVQANAATGRPDYRQLPMRRQFVEMLLRMSLEAAPVVEVPEELAGGITTAAGLVNLVTGRAASVEDAAEAALRLYVVLSWTPNVPPDAYRDQPWVTVDLAQARYDPQTEDAEQIMSAFLDAHQRQDRVADDEEYTPMPPVVHRGDLTPDLQQALQKLQRQSRHIAQLRQPSGGEDQDRLGELSDDELLAPVEEYIGMGEIFDDWGDDAGSGFEREEMSFTREDALRILRGRQEQSRYYQVPHVGEDEVRVAVYDEWDYRAKAYRPKWCQVRQRRLKAGSGEFYDDTLARHRWLVQAVRQQFEMLRPENLGRIKRLQDGEEYDLDAVIEARVERMAGHTPSEKIYWRRNKTDRSVAVALLVDLSVSTRERIEADRKGSTVAGNGGGDAQPQLKRIIDLERESVVLFIEALEQIGDAYGIYGFSGSGREDVQFYTIKDMQETFGDRVRRRVGQMAPLQGTRMGPAIRQRFDEFGPGSIAHAAMMMDEKEYAVHDTKQALIEIRSRGVTPFCISVDKQGRDYMRAMCGDIGYEVVSDIQSLPRRLPALYKRMTT